LLSGKDAIVDVKFSPDGRNVSYVSQHNIHVITLSDGKTRAITSGGSEEIRKGELDWVYPEELDLKTAYWWSPDSTKIAFLEMDERKVSKYPLLDFASYEGEADEERYPVAGGANPIVKVYAFELASGKSKLLDTGAETNQYIPRVDWLPDSKHIAIQRLNRAQERIRAPYPECDLVDRDKAAQLQHARHQRDQRKQDVADRDQRDVERKRRARTERFL